MRIYTCIGVVFSCLLGGPPAAAAELETALGLLLIEHPNIHAAEKRLISSRYEVDKAASDFLPDVAFANDSGPQLIDNPTTRAAGRDYSRTKHVATLTVTQMLFDGHLADSNTDSARLSVEVAQLALERARQVTLFEGVRAYIEVLRQKRLVDLGLENVDNILQQLHLEDERVQRGSGIAVDVLEAKSRLQIAKERLVTFEGALDQAVAAYKQVFGRRPDLEYMLDPWPPIDLIPASLEDAIRLTLEISPVLDDSATSVELARERRRTAAADLYPIVNLEATANYEKNNDVTIGTRRDYTVLVRSSWNLYSGNLTTASMDQAAYDYRASWDDHAFTERKVIEAVRMAWLSLITVRERVQLLENAVSIAAEIHDSRVKLRSAGKETIINVLDAQNQVTSAQINYTTAAYDEKTATFSLLLAMGRLTARDMDLPTP